MERWISSLKSQVNALISFLKPHPLSVAEEAMAEVKGEAPSLEIFKNELGYGKEKSCIGQRLRGLHDLKLVFKAFFTEG